MSSPSEDPTDEEATRPPLSKEILPRLSWDDLLFSTEVRQRLEHIVNRWRGRAFVLREWGFGRRLKSQGIVALFAGLPGTGKTESASVVAYTLGLRLYQINSPGLLSRYIGETEKNIDAILSVAEQRSDIALVFDEGEALFAKRVEAKGSGELAHNSQIGLLLSRIERFNGLAIVTTNNPAMIDPAFKRRFHVFIEFPMPTPEERAKILKLCLANAPLSDDMDLNCLSKIDELSGGSIQNIAINAAFLAHDKGLTAIDRRTFWAAVRDEMHKIGKLVHDDSNEVGR